VPDHPAATVRAQLLAQTRYSLLDLRLHALPLRRVSVVPSVRSAGRCRNGWLSHLDNITRGVDRRETNMCFDNGDICPLRLRGRVESKDVQPHRLDVAHLLPTRVRALGIPHLTFDRLPVDPELSASAKPHDMVHTLQMGTNRLGNEPRPLTFLGLMRL
jgi:hypothetical protein